MPEASAFRIDPAEISRFFDRISAARSCVNEVFSDHPFVEVTYEDHIARDFESTLTKIADFVGSKHLDPPVPVLRRIESDDPTRLVANFQELAQHFRHTPHEDYFWKRGFPEGYRTALSDPRS